MTEFTQADADEVERIHRERLREILAVLEPNRPYATACNDVAAKLHPILQRVPVDKPITTMMVAQRLLHSSAKKHHPAEYNRLFRILKDIAKGQLKDCTSPGSPKRYMGRVAHPKLWHTGPLHPYDALATVKPAKNTPAPSTNHTICQHCGSILPKV